MSLAPPQVKHFYRIAHAAAADPRVRDFRKASHRPIAAAWCFPSSDWCRGLLDLNRDRRIAHREACRK